MLYCFFWAAERVSAAEREPSAERVSAAEREPPAERVLLAERVSPAEREPGLRHRLLLALRRIII